jgi:hypothetical protein
MVSDLSKTNYERGRSQRQISERAQAEFQIRDSVRFPDVFRTGENAIPSFGASQIESR